MSEGNVTDLATGLKAIDLVPEVNAVGDESVVETPSLKNVPITRDCQLFGHWTRQFMPTGFEVVVDLPFLPNGRDALFLIRCTPEIMPIVPLDNDWWVFQKNAYQFVIHDVTAAEADNSAISDIPQGIFINQIHDPPPLSILTANHRFWRGSLNFHVRTVGNFLQSGYLRTTKLRRVALPMGVYDRYAKCVVPQKQGSFIQQGNFNSYLRSDVTMFRHTEFTIPYERQTPTDMLEKRSAMFNALDVIDNQYDATNQTWRDGNTTVVTDNFEDFIAVEAVGGLAGNTQNAQLRFIIEIAAGSDFDVMTPLPLSDFSFAPQSKYFQQDGSIRQDAVHDSAIKIPDIIPDPSLFSDGQSTILAH